MNMGSWTGPWGSVRIEARAFVVFKKNTYIYTDDQHSSDEGGSVLMFEKYTEWERKGGLTDGAFGYAFKVEGWSI